jgi:hypothetical protein
MFGATRLVKAVHLLTIPILPHTHYMIAIEQTVDIPADRRLHLDITLPESVQSGRADIVLVFSTAESVERAAGEEPGAYTPEPFPGIEELKAEARQKTAERFACPSGDSLQKYCGILKDVFTEDGLEYQRRLRDEWPD